MSVFNSARVREVMRKNHCDYYTACSWLAKRGAEAKAARKRAAARRQELLGRERALQVAMGID